MFQNIISNAVKYTDEGGRIDVSFERNGRFFVVKVKDTGRGIDKKNLPYVFDKFFMEESSRTDSKNSGLGLYVAQNIARRHGGEIKVRSRKGKGSTFSVSIPELPDETTPTQRFEAMPKGSKVVLIACFCFVMPWLLRFMRYFETRRAGTLITGVCCLVLWILCLCTTSGAKSSTTKWSSGWTDARRKRCLKTYPLPPRTAANSL